MATFLKILFIAIFSFFATEAFFILIDYSSAISTHPYIGILARVIFIVILLSSYILRNKDIVLYSFLLCFPFLDIYIYGINLYVIFAMLLAIIYFKEISLNLCKELKPNYIIPISLFLGSIVISVFLAPFKKEAILCGIFFISSMLVYLILKAHLKTEVEFKRTWLCLFVVFILCALVSAYQAIFGINSIRFFLGQYHPNTDMYGFARRIPSIFMDAQEAGQYFAVISLALNGYASLKLRASPFARALSIIAFGALILTISRSAMIGFFIGWILTHFLTNGRRVFFWSIGILVIFFLLKEPVYQYIIPAPIKARFSEYQQLKSADYRLEMWKRSFPIALHNPLGVGIGGNNLYVAGVKVGAKFNYAVTLRMSNRVLTTFESSYLDLLYSVGIIGLSSFLWVIFLFFLQNVDHILKIQKYYKKAAFYFLGAICAWLIAAFTSSLLFKTQSMLLYILMIVSIQFVISWKKKDEIISHNRLL